MIALIKFLIYGHLHKWEILEKAHVENISAGRSWTRHYCRCTKCGSIKKFD